MNPILKIEYRREIHRLNILINQLSQNIYSATLFKAEYVIPSYFNSSSKELTIKEREKERILSLS